MPIRRGLTQCMSSALTQRPTTDPAHARHVLPLSASFSSLLLLLPFSLALAPPLTHIHTQSSSGTYWHVSVHNTTNRTAVIAGRTILLKAIQSLATFAQVRGWEGIVVGAEPSPEHTRLAAGMVVNAAAPQL